jgi:outer membrane receptor protein involved in Fe transport
LLQAQTATPPAAAPKPEETVELSPFTVNTDQDTGYIATDSLVGGRLSTQLLKTPSDVTVLTRDFLTDIGATDYIAASAYLTNTYVIPVNGQDFGSQNNFRGLGGGFPTRNYFKQNDSLDYYNVERVESARGPNALLFGDGIVGGIINTVSKSAKVGRSFREASLRVDSEGSMRGTFDINQSLGQMGALRVNAVKDGDRNYIDSYFKNRIGITLAGTFRIGKTDEIRIETEAADLKFNYTPQSFTDRNSAWNGVPFVGPSTTNPTGATGINRFTTDQLVYVPNVGVLNYLNYGNSAGSNLAQDKSKEAFVPNLHSVSRDFSLQPTNAVGDVRRELFAAYWDHQWTAGLHSEFAAQYAKYDRSTETFQPNAVQVDVNSFLPGGTPNVHFGQLYAEAPVTHTDQTNRHYDYRFVTAYDLPITWWKQTINAMVSRRVEFFFANDFRWARNNNPAVPSVQNAANYFYFRVYANDNALLLNTHPVNDGTYTWIDSITRLRSQRQQLDTAQAATVASIWKDKITVIGGFRHDLYKSFEYQVGTYGPDGLPLTQAILTKELTANVGSGGLTFFPIPSIGVYANISQTFNPIGAGDASLYKQQFNYTHGIGYSGGLRFRLLDGKIVGSLGYYDVKETGRVTGYSLTEINRIWTNINQSQNQVSGAGYRDTSDIASKGYELDLVANASKNLKLKLNFGIPKTKQSNALPDTISYFNKNIATWNAALAASATQDPNQVQTDINALITRIQSGNQGRALNGQPDYTASIFANYTLPWSFLKQFSVGGGASLIGKRIVGNSVTNAFDYIKSPAYYTATGTLGYQTKVLNRNVRFQLNVNNLLDYNKPVYTNVATYNGKNYKNAFYYFEPRKFLLTATVGF